MSRDIVAVNVVIINEAQEVLIAKRLKHQPMPESWEFPGGKCEAGESLEACGIREIKEELALDITIQTYLGEERLEYEGRRFALHFYTAGLIREDQQMCLNAHSEARWIKPESLGAYELPAERLAVIQKFKEMFPRMEVKSAF